MMTALEREVQAGFPEVHDVNAEGHSVFKRNERRTCKHESLDNSLLRYGPMKTEGPSECSHRTGVIIFLCNTLYSHASL